MSAQPSALQQLAQQRIQRAREANQAPGEASVSSSGPPPTGGMAQLSLQGPEPSGTGSSRNSPRGGAHGNRGRGKGRGKARPIEHMFRSADEAPYDAHEPESIPDPAVYTPFAATMDTTHGHTGSPIGISGAKRAQGTAGLNGGGRAKLAKHNLSRLAPKHLQSAALAAPAVPTAAYLHPQEDAAMPDAVQATPSPRAEEAVAPPSATADEAAASPQTQDASSTPTPAAKKSKLQELAAMRLAKKASSSPSPSLSPSPAARTPAKTPHAATASSSASTPASALASDPPRSKLAAKIAAIKAAKASGGVVPTGPGAAAPPAPGPEPEPEAPQYAPSGVRLAALFPLPQSEGAGADASLVACVPDGWRSALPASTLPPGGSPFDPWSPSDERWAAFAGPSPDDKVMLARAGTRLAG